MFESLDFFQKKNLLKEFLKYNKKFINVELTDFIIIDYLLFNNKSYFIKYEKMIEVLNEISLNFLIYKKPFSKSLEKKQFYNEDFIVNENVLCPREETELIIEIIKSKKMEFKIEFNSVLDLGTGSGILGIILKKLYPNSKITAIDISKKTLETAKKNAILHNIQINFIENDWLQNINQNFDLLISNPPYLTREEINENEKELSYDPDLALFGGVDGLDRYRDISEKKDLFSYILLEINPKHEKKLEKLFPNCEFFEDFNNQKRVLFYQNLKKD